MAGDSQAVVVSILRSRGFPKVAKRFTVRGVFERLGEKCANTKDVLVDPKNHCHFGLDMEWVFTNEDFSSCKNIGINLVIQIIAHDSFEVPEPSELVGILTFPLQNAVQLPSSKNDTMRDDLSDWVKLEEAEGDLELLCSFTVAPREEEGNGDVSAVNITTENFEALVPNLRADEGYFLLGNEETSNDIYYFNVFLAGFTDLSEEFSGDILFFSYHLFGIEILTDEFKTKEDYHSEHASVKIRSNVGNISKFFCETVKDSPFSIYLNGKADRSRVGRAQVDWSRLLFKDKAESMAKLEKGEFLSYSGALPLIKTDGDQVIGKVIVRFSLGLRQDHGLEETSEIDESLYNEALSARVPRLSPHLQRGQKLSSMSINGSGIFQNSSQKRKSPDSLFDSEPVMPKPAHRGDEVRQPLDSRKESVTATNTDVEQCYKFIFHLVSVGVVEGESKAANCSIVCVDGPFRLQNLKQKSFGVTSSTSMENIKLFTVPDIMYNISFKAKPSKVEKVFGQKDIVWQVLLDDVPRGKATIPLSRFVNALNFETTQANIVSRTGAVVGIISCRCSLIPSFSEAAASVVPNIVPKVVPNVVPNVASMAERDAIRATEEELRLWKQREKKLFLEELKNIKRSQLEELSQEWKKQEMEFRQYQETRKKDLVEAEKSLFALVRKYKEHQKRLHEKENQKNEEWRKRESMDSVALRETENQLRKKDLEIAKLKSENQSMKTEIQQLKEANELLKNRLAFPERQNLEGFMPLDVLNLPRTPVNLPSTASSNTNGSPLATVKTPSLEDVKLKLLKTNVYKEGDDLIQLIAEMSQSGT